jgi:Protein of unknown function (DUF2950)
MRPINRLCCRLFVAACLVFFSLPSVAEPQSFATPNAAVSALKAALGADDVDALVRIFGEEHSEIVLGSDPASGRVTRKRASAALREKLSLRRDGEDRMTLLLGKANWPMPVPLVRRDGRWLFDGEEGEQEILARRIGENEIAAIDALKTFAAAERAYAARRVSAGQGREYARHIQSTPRQTDGLWWDEEMAAVAGPSPLAGFVARNRPFLDGRRPGDPFKGYFFRVLMAQGMHAPGGAMSYLEAGRMTKGFAMIAWPADYGTAGVMTFIVGPDGRVLEQDLGEETASTVRLLLSYDPDPAWRRAER